MLTDICMKQMSELTLIEKVKALDNNISFIVVRAYRYFEYAQKACEIGAFSYLLKPLDEEKLKDTMKAVYDYCTSHKHRKIYIQNLVINIELLLQDSYGIQNRFFKYVTIILAISFFLSSIG